jgi:hydrophobic/amphiphilic exporter-1 (mainly G- bacteria), HAE1 family
MFFLSYILDHRTFVAMTYTALLLIGAAVINRLPLELSPEVEYPQFSIITNYPGASPEVVEAVVTSRIEQAVQRLPGVRSVGSTSTEGNSRVTVQLQPQVEMDYILLEMNEQLSMLDEEFPREVTYPRIQRFVPRELQDLQGFIILTVTGPGTINDVRRITDRHFIRPLLGVPGISDVSVSGGTERIVGIEVDHSLMQAYGVRMPDVQRALDEYRRRVYGSLAGAGTVREGTMKIPLIIETSPDRIEDIRRAIVRTTPEGRTIHLDDIARVTMTYDTPKSYRRINGLAAVAVTIEREPGTNIVRTADRVYRALDRVRAALPPGYDVRIRVDRSTEVRDELGTLSNRAVLALAFVLIVLIVTLGSVRSPLYVISTILFSVFITLIGFYFAGLSVNVLTLAGLTLAFGMLVDNSIVVFDSIDRSVRAAPHYREALLDGASRVFLPVFAATGTTVVAFIPFVLMSEELRPFFSQFATALVLSLTASLFVSFTLIPLLSYRFPIVTGDRRDSGKLHSLIIQKYESILLLTIRRKTIVIILSMLVIGIPVWLLPERVEVAAEDNGERSLPARIGTAVYNGTVGSEAYAAVRPYLDHALGGATHLFFTYVHRGEVWQWGEATYLIVRVSMPFGTEIGRLNDVMRELERQLLRFDDRIEFFETNIYANDEGQIRIEFPPAVQTGAFPHILKGYLTSYMAQLGGADVGIYGFGPGYYSGGAAAPSFYVQFLGYNYYKLRDLADEFAGQLERNPRVANVETDRTFGRRDNMFEVAARIDRDAMMRYRLSVDDVMQTLRTRTRESVSGGRWFLDGDDIRYVVRYTGSDELSVDDLLSQPVPFGEGTYKLSDIIRLEERRTLARIDREDQQYRRMVSFDYRGPWRLGSAFVDRVKEEFDLPYGYSIVDHGRWFMLHPEQELELTFILLLSVLFIFMVTASLYESFRKPLIVMITVPFAVAGVFMAFYLTGAQFDRGGYAAIALLAGISINNSILMVDAIARNHTSTALLRAIVTGASVRIRAITITTLTTVAGLVPLLLEGDGAPFWYGLGLGTIGGLIASYFVVLFLCPVVYAVVMGVRGEPQSPINRGPLRGPNNGV